jgi:hypothetical protein
MGCAAGFFAAVFSSRPACLALTASQSSRGVVWNRLSYAKDPETGNKPLIEPTVLPALMQDSLVVRRTDWFCHLRPSRMPYCKNNRKFKDLWYIDAFAGTGERTVRRSAQQAGRPERREKAEDWHAGTGVARDIPYSSPVRRAYHAEGRGPLKLEIDDRERWAIEEVARRILVAPDQEG